MLHQTQYTQSQPTSMLKQATKNQNKQQPNQPLCFVAHQHISTALSATKTWYCLSEEFETHSLGGRWGIYVTLYRRCAIIVVTVPNCAQSNSGTFVTAAPIAYLLFLRGLFMQASSTIGWHSHTGISRR